MEYVAPTPAERDSGAVLICDVCERPWPLRLCVPSLRRCVNCARDWWREEKEARRGHHWRAYGLSKRDVSALLAEQRGGCAICSKEISLSGEPRAQLDHCHSTGQPRGLLCLRCNTSIGRFDDNPELLRKAAEYIEDRRTLHGHKRPKQMRTIPRIPLRPRKPHDFVTKSGERINLANAETRERLRTDPIFGKEVDAYLISRIESARAKRKKPVAREELTVAILAPGPRLARAPDDASLLSEYAIIPSPRAIADVDGLLGSEGEEVIDISPLEE